jgi:hypothetical protein
MFSDVHCRLSFTLLFNTPNKCNSIHNDNNKLKNQDTHIRWDYRKTDDFVYILSNDNTLQHINNVKLSLQWTSENIGLKSSTLK